eukprot:EG_transcript_19682
MSVTLLLVRHAQSANNVKNKAEGSETGREADPGITDVGVEQAQLLAEYLRGLRDDPVAPLRIDRLLTSAMTRTLETCRPVCAALGLGAHVVADLHEQGGLFVGPRTAAVSDLLGSPVLAGMTAAELKARYPFVESAGGVGETGWWNRPYESVPETNRRAHRVVELFKDLAYRFDGQTILVMTHGWFIEILMKALLGLRMPVDRSDLGPVYMPTYCTSVSTVKLVAPTEQFPEWSVGLVTYNTVPHLRDHPHLFFGSSRGPVGC